MQSKHSKTILILNDNKLMYLQLRLKYYQGRSFPCVAWVVLMTVFGLGIICICLWRAWTSHHTCSLSSIMMKKQCLHLFLNLPICFIPAAGMRRTGDGGSSDLGEGTINGPAWTAPCILLPIAVWLNALNVRAAWWHTKPLMDLVSVWMHAIIYKH